MNRVAKTGHHHAIAPRSVAINENFRIVWSAVLAAWEGVSVLAKGGTKSCGSGRCAAIVGSWKPVSGALLLTTLHQAAIGQACTATGGTISISTTAGCTISTAGSTLTLASPAIYTGWLNATGNNTGLTVDSGASFVAGGLGGNPFSSGISVSGPALAWSLTNNGQLLSTGTGWDLLGFRAAGGTYSVINTGTMQVGDGLNVIEANSANTALSVTNSGAMLSRNDRTIHFTGNGSFTLNNQTGGQINATGATVISLDGQPATVDITNAGTISSGGNNAIYMPGSGTATITNDGTITTTAANAIQSNYALNLVNRGTISTSGGGLRALELGGGGAKNITNAAGAVIQSLNPGHNVAIGADGTVTLRNAGTISVASNPASNWAIYMGGGNDTIILEPTSSIIGLIEAGGGQNTMVLGGNSGSGTFNLTPWGEKYRNFQYFQKIEDSTWTLTGAAVVNLEVMDGTAEIASGASMNIPFTSAAATGPVTLRVAGAVGGLAFNSPLVNSVVLETGATFGAGVFLNNAGTNVLTGPVAFPNAVTIAGGTLQVGDGGAGTGGFITGPIVDNSALVFNHSDDITHAGAISGTGTLAQSGTATLTLSGANTYSGGTLLNAGTLSISNNNNLGTDAGALTFNGGTLVTTAGIVSARAMKLVSSGTMNNGGNNNVFSGEISGAGGLTVAGTGTATLTGNNTYTGGTTISEGTLQVGAGGTSGSIVGDVVDNGTLAFNRSDAVSYANVISGTGSVSKAGAGTLTLSGANAYGGGTTVSAGTLVATQAGALSTGAVSNNATLQLDFAGNSVLPNTLSGSGSLVKTGSGTASLTAANSGQGSVSVNAGTLQFAQAGAFNVGGNYNSASGATTSMGAQATLTASGLLSMDGTLDDVAGKAQAALTASSATIGAGATFNLAGFSAPAATSASQLAASRYTEIHTTTGGLVGTFANVNLAGATSPADYMTLTPIYTAENFDIGLALTWYAAHGVAPPNANGTFTLTNGAGSFDLDAVLADEAPNPATGWDGKSLTKAGPGTLQLSKPNTYTGDTLINEGTLRAGASNVFAGSRQVSVAAGAVLDLNSFDQRANNLAGMGSVVLGSAILDADNTADSTFGGVISGSGSLNKTGDAALMLTQNQTYAGTTAVTAGSLILANEAQLASTQPVTVASGATLGGYGGVGGNVINSGLLAVADAAPIFANGPAGNFTVGGHLINSGEIRMASPVPASTLIVRGNYIGNNGLMTLSTVLGGDDSATDRMVVQGSTAGSTRVVVNNAGGAGAPTTSGIQIVQVQGASDGSFALQGRAVAGPYEYRLLKGTPAGNDGNWYLSSAADAPPPEPPPPAAPPPAGPPPAAPPPAPAPAPLLRPEAGTYLANQGAATAMLVHTLHDRLGEPRLADAAQGSNGYAGSGWARIRGTSFDGTAAGGRIDQSGQSSLAHFGADLINSQDTGGRLYVGVMGAVGQGSNKSVAQGSGVRSRGELDGYSVGAYATWYADPNEKKTGFYLDGWAQYGWFRNKTSGDQLPTEGYDSRSWASSLEGGYSFLMSEQEDSAWYIEPQAQILYSDYRQDDLTEANGTRVQSDDAGGLTSRLGARIYGRKVFGANTVQPFVELNWWHGQHQASILMNEIRVNDGTPKDRYEVKTGIQAQLGRQWHVWGDIGVQAGKNSYSNLAAQIGAKLVW